MQIVLRLVVKTPCVLIAFPSHSGRLLLVKLRQEDPPLLEPPHSLKELLALLGDRGLLRNKLRSLLTRTRPVKSYFCRQEVLCVLVKALDDVDVDGTRDVVDDTL